MLHGILFCDKPAGITSHKLVDRIRKHIGQREVGHAGTLDPLATGLMLVLLGEATKISDYVLNEDKAYQVKVRFGLETDSWDTDGEVLKEEAFSIDESALKSALPKMTGELQLQVPQFSAVKKDGKKLYELARKNLPVEAPVRPMRFWGLESHIDSQNEASFQFRCTKGSFVRSWAMEIGRQLGTVGTVAELRRTASGLSQVEQALPLERLEDMSLEDIRLSTAFQGLDQCLSDWGAVFVKGRDKKLLMNGQVPHETIRRLIPQQKQANRENQGQFLRVLDGQGSALLALIEIAPFGPIRVKRVFKHLDAPT